MKVDAVILQGSYVRLEPIRSEHAPALWRAGAHPEIWRYIPYPMRDRSDMRRLVERAVQESREA